MTAALASDNDQLKAIYGQRALFWLQEAMQKEQAVFTERNIGTCCAFGKSRLAVNKASDEILGIKGVCFCGSAASAYCYRSLCLSSFRAAAH